MDWVAKSDCCDFDVQEDERKEAKYYYKCMKCGKPCTITKKELGKKK